MIAACTALTAALASVAAVGLASCSMNPAVQSPATAGAAVERPPLGDLYAQVKAATLGATSVHLHSDAVENGKRSVYDVVGRLDGTNQRVRRTAEGEGTVEFLVVGGKAWEKGDAAALRSQGLSAAEIAASAGKYVEMSPAEAKELDDPSSGLAKIFSTGEVSFLDQANTVVEDVTEQGVPAWKLSDRVGSEGATWIVSADGKAHLLKIVATSTDPGTDVFTEWDAVPPFTPPLAKDTFVTG
jgi:hypothetical protein